MVFCILLHYCFSSYSIVEIRFLIRNNVVKDAIIVMTGNLREVGVVKCDFRAMTTSLIWDHAHTHTPGEMPMCYCIGCW